MPWKSYDLEFHRHSIKATQFFIILINIFPRGRKFDVSVGCCSLYSTICFATVLKTQGLHFSRLKNVFFLFYLNIKYKYSEYDVDRWKKENFYSHIWSDPTQISNLLKHKKNCAFLFCKKKASSRSNSINCGWFSL